jgi:hypothetical protein
LRVINNLSIDKLQKQNERLMKMLNKIINWTHFREAIKNVC